MAETKAKKGLDFTSILTMAVAVALGILVSSMVNKHVISKVNM